MQLKKTMQTLMIGGALAAAIVVVPTTTAQAAPSNCSGQATVRNTYEGNCTRGSGQFRAVAYCYRPGSSNKVNRYGPWRRVNTVQGISIAYCSSSEEVRGGYVQTRN